MNMLSSDSYQKEKILIVLSHYLPAPQNTLMTLETTKASTFPEQYISHVWDERFPETTYVEEELFSLYET